MENNPWRLALYGLLPIAVVGFAIVIGFGTTGGDAARGILGFFGVWIMGQLAWQPRRTRR